MLRSPSWRPSWPPLKAKSRRCDTRTRIDPFLAVGDDLPGAEKERAGRRGMGCPAVMAVALALPRPQLSPSDVAKPWPSERKCFLTKVFLLHLPPPCRHAPPLPLCNFCL